MRRVRPAGAAIASRILAAAAGGYALSAASAVWLAVALPGPRSEATTAGSLASFAVMTGAVLWAFAARTPARAWTGLAIPAAALAVLATALAPGGAP